MKTKKKISPLRISPFFCPKLGEDQKNGLHSILVRFLAQNYVKTKDIKRKNGLYPDSVLLCALTFCPSYKGGGHAAILHTILC